MLRAEAVQVLRAEAVQVLRAETVQTVQVLRPEAVRVLRAEAVQVLRAETVQTVQVLRSEAVRVLRPETVQVLRAETAQTVQVLRPEAAQVLRAVAAQVLWAGQLAGCPQFQSPGSHEHHRAACRLGNWSGAGQCNLNHPQIQTRLSYSGTKLLLQLEQSLEDCPCPSWPSWPLTVPICLLVVYMTGG